MALRAYLESLRTEARLPSLETSSLLPNVGKAVLVERLDRVARDIMLQELIIG
jgi:hypothetical protein